MKGLAPCSLDMNGKDKIKNKTFIELLVVVIHLSSIIYKCTTYFVSNVRSSSDVKYFQYRLKLKTKRKKG